MPFLIIANGVKESSEPVEGRWYAGVTDEGRTGALAKYEFGRFSNSESDDYNMSIYPAIEELPERSK